jgi:hypothetical protein
MLTRALLIGTFVCGSIAGFAEASPTPDAMRAAAAVQINTKYFSSITLTKDPEGNIISFHVNGVSPGDAKILLTKDSTPLSTEFTIVSGVTKEGGISIYMIPSSIATPLIVESISQDLVNAGAVSIQIQKQQTGRA